MPADHGVEQVVARVARSGALDDWDVIDGAQADSWSVYRPRGTRPGPESGYKIHVSATVASAGDVLSRVLPIVLDARVTFKHAGSARHVAQLSSWPAAGTQLGKLITVYPADEEAAVQLAARLHVVTRGLDGPRIEGDAPFAPGSLVHFRYGGFEPCWLQLPTGRIVPGRRVDGRVEPDDRARPSSAPGSGDADAGREPRGAIVGGKYVRVQRMHENAKGSTWLGFALDSADDLLVIKEARSHVMVSASGQDARARLRSEAAVLRALAGVQAIPSVVDSFDEPDRSVLVYRLVEGPTFAAVIRALAEEGTPVDPALLHTWAVDLCRTVAAVHDRGMVVGDIKPDNLILNQDGFHLIDFELAGPPITSPVGGIGTPGYASPQQLDPSLGRAFTDDVHAIGATLLSAVLLVEAGTLPDPWAVAHAEHERRPDDPILATLERCLRPDAHERFDDVAAIPEALQATVAGGRRSPGGAQAAQPSLMDHATAIGDRLLSAGVRDGDHLHWASAHPIQQGRAGRDLYAGSAGVALYLQELYRVTGAERFIDGALACGRWLSERTPSYESEVPMPGLYFGEGGTALLLTALYGATGDDTWAARALEVAGHGATVPSHSPDLLVGDAGAALAAMAVAAGTGVTDVLAGASAAVERLASGRDPGACTWTVPPGHEALSGQRQLGLAHGTAGIGYAVAELAARTGDANARELCSVIADWLTERAEPCLSDGRGLTWPMGVDGASPRLVHWCHGAAGILRFLIAAHAVSGAEHIWDAAVAAGRTVAARSDWSGPTQCHGLAGNAEALIDLWSLTGEQRWLDEARRLGDQLVTYRGPEGWPSEYRGIWAPDLLVGEAGVGAALLRLAHPRRPNLVSPAAVGGARLETAAVVSTITQQ